jgi:hypothetical protein
MNSELSRLIGPHGVCHRRDLVASVRDHILEYAVVAGHVVRLFPEVYALPSSVDDPVARCRAALLYAGTDSALSHRTALQIWGLPVPTQGPLDVTTPLTRRLRNASDVIVHRRSGFKAERPHAVTRSGLTVVRLERAIAENWPLLEADDQRAPAIVGVRERRTTAQRLLGEVTSMISLVGRRELIRLAGLLAHGCYSELEVWGTTGSFGTRTCHLQRLKFVCISAEVLSSLIAYSAARGSTSNSTARNGISRLPTANVTSPATRN